MVRPKAPIWLAPASSQLSGLVDACQMGGCGRWIGFGMISRSGTRK